MIAIKCFACGSLMTGGYNPHLHYLCVNCGPPLHKKIGWDEASSLTPFYPDGPYQKLMIEPNLGPRCPQCHYFHGVLE